MFVSLQLVVGPNSLPELPKSLKNSSSRSHTLTSVDIVTGLRDTGYPTGTTGRGKYLYCKCMAQLKTHMNTTLWVLAVGICIQDLPIPCGIHT